MLETVNITAAEIFDVVNDFKLNLRAKITEQFFGSVVRNGLLHLSKKQKDDFNQIAKDVYQRVLDYMEKYDNPILRKLSALNIAKNNLSFNNLLELLDEFGLKEVNQDVLFDEVIINRHIDKIRDEKQGNQQIWIDR